MRKTDETMSPMSGKAFHIQPWSSPYTAKEPPKTERIVIWYHIMDQDTAKMYMNVTGAFTLPGFKPGSKFTIVEFTTRGFEYPMGLATVEVREPR